MNFVFSLRTLSLVQRQWLHPLTDEWYIIDKNRFEFKGVTIGRRIKHKQSPSHIHSRSQSITHLNVTPTNKPATTPKPTPNQSLLQHFNIPSADPTETRHTP